MSSVILTEIEVNVINHCAKYGIDSVCWEIENLDSAGFPTPNVSKDAWDIMKLVEGELIDEIDPIKFDEKKTMANEWIAWRAMSNRT